MTWVNSFLPHMPHMPHQKRVYVNNILKCRSPHTSFHTPFHTPKQEIQGSREKRKDKFESISA
jgi:hypothetical protein